MVKTREKIIRLREKDEAIINFVNRQAQDAILDPNIPDTYKDSILNAAIGVIHKVAFRGKPLMLLSLDMAAAYGSYKQIRYR